MGALSTHGRVEEECFVLEAHFHKDLEANAGHSGRERILANNLSEIFTAHSGSAGGVRHGDEEAHADFVADFAGLEIDARSRNAESSAHVIEMVLLGIRRTNQHELSDFAAAAATAFGGGLARRSTPAIGDPSHWVLLSRHR
jgi:hypothetical protein